MINKIGEKLICRKCYKKFVFKNLLYTHFKSKSYRKKIIRFKKLSKNKGISYDLTLMKEFSVIKELKLIELMTSSTFSNGISFRF